MKIKKIIAAVLAAAIAVSCFAFGMTSAFAKTQEIKLDIEMSNTIDGLDDKNWYYFTPSQTGVYTFLSFNKILYAEAFLFVKTQKDGVKTYTQLAYSNDSPDYEKYEQPNRYQFCLKYNLVAGNTYYFAAGWDSSRTNSTMTVKLIYEGDGSDWIDHLTVSCNAELTWYTDGSWERDTEGKSYFYYNYSRIIQNMIVTIFYADGSSSSSALGSDTVDGFDIRYSHTQSVDHWYPEQDERYTGNILTIKVLNKSVDYNVVINQDALLTVSGKVCDYINEEPVSGANISVNGAIVASTSSNGSFSFAYSPGYYTMSVSGENIITRTFNISVDTMEENNDHSAQPIGVVVGDYVKDGIINGKDYAYIQNVLSGDGQKKEEEKFAKQFLFKSDKYPELIV